MKYKIVIILTSLAFVFSSFLFKNLEKDKLKQSKIIEKNKCKLLKNDLPKKTFLLFDRKNMITHKNKAYCKFIFGCKLINESSIVYVNQDYKNGVYLLEKFSNDSIVSEIFINFKDTTGNKINNKHFRNYTYKLSSKKITQNDTLYIYEFVKNTTTVSVSHECFLPLKQIYVSKLFGINKIVLEDYCFQVTYE